MLFAIAPAHAEFEEYDTFIKFWAEYVYPYLNSSPALPDPGYSYNTISVSTTQNDTLQNQVLKHSGGKMLCIIPEYTSGDFKLTHSSLF